MNGSQKQVGDWLLKAKENDWCEPCKALKNSANGLQLWKLCLLLGRASFSLSGGANKSIFHRINNNKKKEKDGIHLHQWQVAFIYGTWVMYSRRMLEGTMTIRKYFPLKNDIADQALMRIMNVLLCNLMLSTYVREDREDIHIITTAYFFPLGFYYY